MGKSQVVIQLSKFERCKPETIARLATEHLMDEDCPIDTVDNFFRILLTQKFIYGWLEENCDIKKEITPELYEEPLGKIFQRKTWSPYLTEKLWQLRAFFDPKEWTELFKDFAARTKAYFLSKGYSKKNKWIVLFDEELAGIERSERIAKSKEKAAERAAAKKARKRAKQRKQMGLPVSFAF